MTERVFGRIFSSSKNESGECMSNTKRQAVIVKHRARITTEERKNDMDSYRARIIAMLDTVTDAKIMRIIHDVVKAFLINR